jgi:hypothetical protein
VVIFGGKIELVFWQVRRKVGIMEKVNQVKLALVKQNVQAIQFINKQEVENWDDDIQYRIVVAKLSGDLATVEGLRAIL